MLPKQKTQWTLTLPQQGINKFKKVPTTTFRRKEVREGREVGLVQRQVKAEEHGSFIGKERSTK